jgi:hypothetical protein
MKIATVGYTTRGKWNFWDGLLNMALRGYYEFKSLGYLSFLALMFGVFLCLGIDTEQSSKLIVRGFILTLAPILGIAWSLLPTARTDTAWEISSGEAATDGTRDLIHILSSFAMVFALLSLAIFLFHLPLQALKWFLPRAIWFAAPALITLLWTRNTPLALGIVVLTVALPYCPLPKSINPNIFQEPRAVFSGLMALLAALIPFARSGWKPPLLTRAGLSAILAILLLFPLW